MQTPRILPMTMGEHSLAMDLWQNTPGIGLSQADGPESMEAYLRRNQDLSQCAWMGETLVGTILAGHDGRRGFLHHLCVHQEFRRQGIARLLLSHALAALAAQGMDKVHAFLFANNEEGRRFWTRMGWTWREDIGVVSYLIQTQGD